VELITSTAKGALPVKISLGDCVTKVGICVVDVKDWHQHVLHVCEDASRSVSQQGILAATVHILAHCKINLARALQKN
jgi:hypothetical protein